MKTSSILSSAGLVALSFFSVSFLLGVSLPVVFGVGAALSLLGIACGDCGREIRPLSTPAARIRVAGKPERLPFAA